MYPLFRERVSTLVTLTPAEWATFEARLYRRSLPRGGFWLQAGMPCEAVAFIQSGLLRYYYIREGEEKTGQFFFSGTWAADYAAFLTRTPATVYLQALEPTELLLLSYDDMQALYQEVPKLERFGRLLAEQIYIATQARNASLLKDSPEERYRQLLAERPKVIARIPQYHIASYLGIKPESLSRIRRRMARGSDLNPSQ